MPKRSIAPVEGDRVRLRLLDESDLPMTLAWRNQDHIRKWFFHSDIISPQQHRSWYEQYRERDDDFVFIIEETRTLKRPVGQVALYAVDWHLQRAEFGRLLIGDSASAGMGIAHEATSLLIDYAFTHLGIALLKLKVISSNARAISVYKWCGFSTVSEEQGSLTMILEQKPRG